MKYGFLLWILSLVVVWVLGFLVVYNVIGFPEGILENARVVLERGMK